MYKFNSILLMLLFVAVQAFAGPVSKEEAMLKAKAFMAGKGMKVVSVDLARKAPSKSPTASASTANAAYYVFNAEQDGFVIISGDDRTVPVLGYSDSGSFNEENMPDNLKAWLEDYADQIAALDAGAQPARVSLEEDAIGPLLKTTWNQMTPYNNECPEYSTGNKCATGCTATATAQVVRYHYNSETPTTATAIPGYTTGSYGIAVLAIEATTFDWANMKDSYNGTYTTDEAAAIAKLMRYVGQSMEMDYGPESGSSTQMAVKGLVTYMGYDQNASCESRANYTIQAWHDLIYNELKVNRPVLYGGQSSGGGHSFVVDGYDGNGLYHINWGWGGYCDGYFSLEVLNPSGGGTGASTTAGGYSFVQNCAIGLIPDTGGASTPKYIDASMLAYADGKLSCTFTNNNHTATDFYIGFAFVNDEGEISEEDVFVADSCRYPGMSYSIAPSIVLSEAFNEWQANSTYKIIPVSRQTGQTEWKPCMTPDDYVEVKVDASGNLTVTVYPIVNLEVTGIVLPDNVESGKVCNVKVTVKNNNTSADYRGKLLLTATGQNTETAVQEIEGLYVEANSFATVIMSPKFSVADTYDITFAIAEDASDSYTLLPPTATVTVAQGTLEVEFSPTIEDGNLVFANTFYNGSSDAYLGYISFDCYRRDTDGEEMEYCAYWGPWSVTIPSGYAYNFSLTLDGIQEGYEYQCVAKLSSDGDSYDELDRSDIVAIPITVSVTDAGYATYCPTTRSLDFSEATDIQAYKATVSGSRVVLTKVDVVNKGDGVILCSDGAASEAIPLLTDGTTDNTENLMVGLMANTTIYETAVVGSETYTNYVLAKKNGKIAFYKANPEGTGTALTAGKAYLRVPAASAANFFSIGSDDDGTTGINETIGAPAADNAFYTLQGIRVDAPTKGLYIHRGHKVIIK